MRSHPTHPPPPSDGHDIGMLNGDLNIDYDNYTKSWCLFMRFSRQLIKGVDRIGFALSCMQPRSVDGVLCHWATRSVWCHSWSMSKRSIAEERKRNWNLSTSWLDLGPRTSRVGQTVQSHLSSSSLSENMCKCAPWMQQNDPLLDQLWLICSK